ncbi:MAG: phosphoglucosamine mutase [Pseudomonadales bacterium]|jgi:phosphoglucosamine mutase|nr:phosphoglucosamine mutase [Pseudomonadales bacterium]MDP7145390.1 phosphoglucosamine mutase [Pseudomonadales bacterium]MDP7359581.1 phosphoglucosamine mutase [Pseudomonadales bacterium]MDP7595818.1 phosphoglucosamine mutase [Pseudomonadales bacterium]HJN49950.1 phosphoglucosamine mutase [Pseudomonadales bacterium]
MHRKYFGTDGIRGRVGEDPITPEFMLKLGWAAGKIFAAKGPGKILIGKDTRISGYMFESALEAGLSAAGVDVCLLGPMPTPAIAYLTRTFNAQAGIVISASHNPYYDNGIKFFTSNGEKLDDAVELAIEELLAQPLSTVESNEIGKVSRINDAAGRYIEFCKSCFPSPRNLNSMKVVLDCANGATYHVAPSVFTELGAEVVETGVTPNGLNINEGGGSTAPQELIAKVTEVDADIGIAFDGDGDRVIMVDHTGEIVDGDELLCIISRYQKKVGALKGGVVGTLMSNLGLEVALQEMEIPFVRASVGDRFVLSELLKRGWSLGGESSGHLLCLDLTSTGDGIVSALLAIAAILDSGVCLHDLKQLMSKYPQTMINVRRKTSVDLSEQVEVQEAVSSIEKRLDGKGRVLLRPSGTEPVVRVMVEGQDEGFVAELAHDLARVVEEAIG